METWQKQYITANLCKLVENTTCDTHLLLRLRSAGILGKSDEEKINCEKEPSARFKLLYDTIQTRTNSYTVITKSLHEEKQSGSAKILLDGFCELGPPHPLAACGIIVDHKAVLSGDIQFDGKTTTLRDLFGGLVEDDVAKILKNDLCEKEYIRYFISGTEKFVLAPQTIPSEPSFYIERALSNRLRLHPNIFKLDCEDVFVFKGMQRVQLTELVRPKTTAESTTQLLDVTSRFILLVHEKDWEEIRSVSEKPTHLIKVEKETVFKNGRNEDENIYLVEETSGYSQVLWQFIQKQSYHKKLYTTEEEFVENLENASAKSRYCICDTPGMGKTWTLASIARKIRSRHPKRIIFFTSLSEFIQRYDKNDQAVNMTDSDVLEFILKQMSTSSLAVSILKQAIIKKCTELDCFLDGLDEVPNEHVQRTKALIRALGGISKNLKIYVTGRPHVLKELEETLGAIAYDILPFSEENQIEYLVQTWLKVHPKSEKSKLQRFASQCLKTLKTTLCHEERDIMGIPLQCYLLSQVCSKEARLFSDPDRNLDCIFPQYTSVYQMFKKFVDLRFASSKLPQEQIKQMKCFHVWKALELLFPEIATEYAKMENVDQICHPPVSFGLLEERHKGHITSEEFLHRTCAEYLVAEYFGDFLLNNEKYFSNNEDSSRSIITYFANDVLSGDLVSENPQHQRRFGLKFYNRFNNSVVIHFLNEYLKDKKKIHVPQFLGETFFDEMEPHKFYQILQCTVILNCFHLLSLFKRLLLVAKADTIPEFKSYFLPIFPLQERGILIEPTYLLLRTITEFSTALMMDTCFQLFQQCFNINLNDICDRMSLKFDTPLHIAAKRGNYELVEYLAEKCKLENRFLLTHCIYHSYGDTLEIVSKRIEICKLLLTRKPALLHERFQDSSIIYTGPLVGRDIHLELIKYLIQAGADFEATRIQDLSLILERRTPHGEKLNMIGCASDYMTSNDINELCRFVIQDINSDFLLSKNCGKWEDPLPFVLSSHENAAAVNIATSIKMITNANLRLINEVIECSKIFAAIRSGNIVNLLSVLLEYGTDYKYKTPSGSGLLHLIIPTEHLEIISYFLHVGLEINERDFLGYTPFLYAVRHEKFDAMMLLIQNGADVYSRDNTGNTCAHNAAIWYTSMDSFHQIVIFLCRTLDFGNIFKSQNPQGATPLHIRLSIELETRQDTIALILDNTKDIVNILDGNGNNLLLSTVGGRKDVSIVKLLHERGSNIHLQDKYGRSALHLAVEVGKLDLVQYFVKHECDINSACHKGVHAHFGRSPLLNSFNNLDVVKYLIEVGADVNATSERGSNIAHNLAYKLSSIDFHELVRYLSTSKNNSHILLQKDARGVTPVHARLGCFSVGKMSSETVKLYLQIEGTDVNETNIEGYNLFLSAVLTGQGVDVLKTLVRYGADYRKCTQFSGNALHLAIRYHTIQSLHTLRYLVTLDVDIFQKSISGMTPLDEAYQRFTELYLEVFDRHFPEWHLVKEIIYFLEKTSQCTMNRVCGKT